MERTSRAAVVATLFVLAPCARAAGIPAVSLEEIVVQARRAQLIGQVDSASQGTVLAEQLENRPVLRPGELLEAVPGLIVTQHSGDGKANQYFLRGFNLDHGTDFATSVDDVPVNMPTHAHGQGYSDVNFLIPELVDSIEYRKGPYYAESGNFSAAGAAEIRYRRRLDHSLLELGGGEDGYRRALLAASSSIRGSDVLVAADYSSTDGAWLLEQDFRKVNGLAKLTRGDSQAGFSLAAMAYDGRWNSTDQIPARAVHAGSVDRFGFIDPSDGGQSRRSSVAAEIWRQAGGGDWRASAYAIDYELDLFSNFTYALDQSDGDQFEQLDDRRVFGGAVEYGRPLGFGRLSGDFAAGVQWRHDAIDAIGLFRTRARERIGTIRLDDVGQTSYSAYASHTVRWRTGFRTESGVRVDRYRFDVRSGLAVNSGSADDTLASPKLSLVFGPWNATEYFVNAGRGFHSNDARGTTIRVDPNDGVTAVERVDPLVRAFGAEAGIRTAAIPHLQLAASFWTLKLDSELLFVGDGGTTEASRASRRSGIEIGAFHAPRDWVLLDADLAWSSARFTDDDPAGDRIPGAVERVASLGATLKLPHGWSAGARARYFAGAPLVEDDSVRSDSTLLVNVEGGYQLTKAVRLSLAVFNLFDREDADITYFYESRLPGEAAPVEDIHFHPVEPRTVRAAVTARF